MARPFIRNTALALALLPLCGVTAAEAGKYNARIEKQAMQDVTDFLDRKDCKSAVAALNKGVADQLPGVLMMAASMFDQGLCVKPDWDKAAHFYQHAHEAGVREALAHLVAGMAQNNRDPAAAMWWMVKGNFIMPPACASANHLAGDTDAFLAAIDKWPSGQLAACTYTAGVLMRMQSEIKFPERGYWHGVSGSAIMSFVPSTGTITWTSGAIHRNGLSVNVTAGDTDQTVFNSTYLKYLSKVGERSLQQFARPEAIDPAWNVKMTYAFHN